MHSSFIYKLSGLSLMVAGLIFLLNMTGIFDGFLPFVWASLMFMALITILVYFIMQRAMAMTAHSNFVMAFGTGFAIKSFASLAFICYFIFVKPIPNTHFIYPFFAMYFMYTGLLVWDIWQASRRKPMP